MIKIEGKHGVSATILADSISPQGIRLITYEITYPRMVLAELNTHGMLCVASASSRAIPFAKMGKQLTARPIRFGEANPGMQDKGVDFDAFIKVPGYCQAMEGGYYTGLYEPELTHFSWPEDAWEAAKNDAIKWSTAFYEAGYHKQVYNRLTEPFQMMKTVLSGTELENFFWLRKHGAADPSLAELARVMFEAREASKPVLLQPGEWHLPYVTIATRHDGKRCYMIEEGIGDWDEMSLEQAIKVSAARCAAVSFRNEDYGLEKCLEVYERLVGDDRKHASSFQHQGTPMKEAKWVLGDNIEDEINVPVNPDSWEQGISHADRQGNLWSAQFKGWIMQRKLIPGENYDGN